MTISKAVQVDPVTIEVVRNSLPAIADEMSLDLQRSSHNMMIYEVRDYCCALLTADGALLSQNLGALSHFVADLGVVIRDGVNRFGRDGFVPGDVIVTNHERVSGQHLNNVCVYTPVFRGDELRGFAAVRAHWIDVGGDSTGFGSADFSRDPWSEGLQLDQLKLWEAGIPDEKVMGVIRDNIRYPESSFGDLRSQVGACNLGQRRLTELDERYGVDVIDEAVARIFQQTEDRCRRVVADIPDGIYKAESFIDGSPNDPEPVVVGVKVTVSGTDMEIDLSGCSPQRLAAINSRTFAGPLIAYKQLTEPQAAVNEGSFAAVKVVIPEGNLMMAKFPAPMAAWSIVLPTVVETIFLALADAIPDRIAASHHAVLGQALAFYGLDEHGRRFVSSSLEGGGWGGRPFEDGPSGVVSTVQGDTRNAPIETLEIKIPLVMEERALIVDSGGAGKFRGGLGVVIQARSLTEGRWNLMQQRRCELLPWGLWGGKSGTRSDSQVKRPNEEDFSSVDIPGYAGPTGTRVRVLSAGGGGWGDPLERDPDAVVADVRDDYISERSAHDDYGVCLTAAGDGFDQQETERLRRRLHTEKIA